VLGKKVRHLLETFAPSVQFFTPDLCYADASKYLPILFAKRHLPDEDALEVLNRLTCLIHVVDSNLYSLHEQEAKLRIAASDIDDWPIVALALLLDCPIWTEDADFFGADIATWTSDRIHLYL
jgi:predicted nucleic acid-binding protein